MSDRIDHAVAALKALGQIRGVDEATNQVTLAIEAQVHATLALVEQQRTANLIAVSANAARMVAEGLTDAPTYVRAHEKWDPQIREGLRL